MSASEKVIEILTVFDRSIRLGNKSLIIHYTIEELQNALIQATADKNTPVYKAIEMRVSELEKAENLQRDTKEKEQFWLKYSKIWVPIFCTFLGSGFTWYFSNYKYRAEIGEMKRQNERLQDENVALKQNYKSQGQIRLEIKNIQEDLRVQKHAIKEKYDDKRARWPEQLNARGLLNSGDLQAGIDDFNRQEAKETADAERVAKQKIGLLEEELRGRRKLEVYGVSDTH